MAGRRGRAWGTAQDSRAASTRLMGLEREGVWEEGWVWGVALVWRQEMSSLPEKLAASMAEGTSLRGANVRLSQAAKRAVAGVVAGEMAAGGSSQASSSRLQQLELELRNGQVEMGSLREQLEQVGLCAGWMGA